MQLPSGMESVIYYTDRLWRSLKRPPRTRRRVPVAASGRLAPWCVTLTRDEEPNYAIAVAAHSGLTLVFTATDVAGFRVAMTAALRRVFDDLGLPGEAFAAEASDIASAPFARLRDSEAREELDHVEFISGCEFPYHDDVGRVQLNLNTLPRGNRVPCVPCEAVLQLFAEPPASSHVH